MWCCGDGSSGQRGFLRQGMFGSKQMLLVIGDDDVLFSQKKVAKK